MFNGWCPAGDVYWDKHWIWPPVRSQWRDRSWRRRSRSRPFLPVHTQSSDSQITLRSDSETQVETHIFGENQVKTQKSLATQAFPTVLRKGWVTKQLWLWRIWILRNKSIDGLLCKWVIIGLQQTLGVSKVKFLVINPWQVLTEPWIKTAPSCVLLWVTVGNHLTEFWLASESTERPTRRQLCLLSIIGAHQKVLVQPRLWYLVWFGFSRSWSSLIDCDCDCNKSGSEWNCESNNLWYDCKHGGDHNRGSDCSNECKVDCTSERKSWLRGRLLAIEALGQLGLGGGGEQKWFDPKPKTQLSNRALT